MTVATEVKLVRSQAQRLVVEAETAVLYYSTLNPRSYDLKQPKSLEFPLEVHKNNLCYWLIC